MYSKTEPSLDAKLAYLNALKVDTVLIDYFLDTLTAAVASVTIAPPYKVAFQLKTAALSTFVWKFLELGIPYPYCAQTFIAAIVYVSRIRRDLIATMNGPLLCERIATGAFITACKNMIDGAMKTSWWLESFDSGMKAAFRMAPDPEHKLFTPAHLCRIEHEFQQLIDYRAMIAPADFLAHYDAILERHRAHYETQRALLQHALFAPRTGPAAEPRIVVGYEIKSAANLPDLTYPDSPSSDAFSFDDDNRNAMEEDILVDCSSDASSSDESPVIITPPNSIGAASSTATVPPIPILTKLEVEEQEPRSKQYPYPTLSYSGGCPDHHHHHPQGQHALSRDAVMEARIRFYAADRGRITLDPSGSPRYVPYSPSQAPSQSQSQHPQPQTQTRVHARSQAAPYPYPTLHQHQHQHQWQYATHGHAAHGGAAARMQQWQSTLPCTDTIWGKFGLFTGN